MQKVYLLLRSNHQTGPYSLEELLQFDLKPYDLIWIEGQSAGWWYPQEIPALQPHLSFLKQTSAAPTPAPIQASAEKPAQGAEPKKIFVAMPSNAVKEEPTPKPSFTPLFNYEAEKPKASEPTQLRQPEELRTTYAKSLEDVETDYMNWAYQKKAKKKGAVSMKGVLVACLIAGVAFASWKMLQPSDENPAKTSPEQTAFLPVQNELPADSAKEEESALVISKSTDNKKQKQDKTTGASTEKAVTTKDAPVQLENEVVVLNEPSQKKPEPVPERVEESKPVAEDKMPEPAATEAPKEKKKLRDKIADLFRKKPEEKKEAAKPAEEERGERQSVRREAGSNLGQMVMVQFEIPNDWMLGIKGAKATLTNRSSEAIAKAVVEVVYYNDDNDVLDKRTITFGNIKKGQKQTVSVPDHQTATRLEYNVVSATGSGEPFALR